MKQYDFDFTKSIKEKRKEKRSQKTILILPVSLAMLQLGLVVFGLFFSPLPKGQTREQFIHNYFEIQQAMSGLTPPIIPERQNFESSSFGSKGDFQD